MSIRQVIMSAWHCSRAEKLSRKIIPLDSNDIAFKRYEIKITYHIAMGRWHLNGYKEFI